MDEATYRELLATYFIPILAGARLEGTQGSTTRHGLSAYGTPCQLLMKPSQDSDYRVEVGRSQKFTPEEGRLAGLFAEELAAIEEAAGPYLPEIMAALPRRVLARLLAPDSAQETVLRLVAQLESLASQTYEGHPVVSAVGVSESLGQGGVGLGSLWEEDFSRVLSNGYDSMYLCGADGDVYGLHFLPVDDESPSFSPNRLGSFALWTAESNDRVAVVLNRNGEVLVFSNGRLQFSKRRGSWRYYPHDAMVARMGQRSTAQLRRALYESALDVSFARTGGCLALIRSDASETVREMIEEDDQLPDGQSVRAQLLSQVVESPFDQLDRRLRQELLAIDGATVVAHDGTLITAGAIISVPGGSQGGGRRAAAVALSQHGLALKISEDGPILGFVGGDEEPVLET